MGTKQETIKQIKEVVNSGKIVRVNHAEDSHGITLWLSDNGKYIYFQNYGQSAVKNNLKNLSWVINTLYGVNRKEISYKVVNGIYV